jgi:phage tail-like protein
MAQTSTRVDPWRGFNFRVEIDSTTVASFSEITGLTAEGDAVDYREGTDQYNTVRKLVGLRKYSAITLKNGMTTDITLFNMYTLTATGDPTARRNGTIVLQDETHKDVMFFHFVNGFVNKLEGPHLTASGNEVAIQSAEIVHEGLTIQLAK